MKSHEFVPFIAGISATAPTFSRNGKWVAYLSCPQHSVWRSRSDGTELVIDMQGGQPQKIADRAFYASWSPDV
jgi:hypothetical protein